MDVVALKGKHLKEVLEHSVRDYDPQAIDPPGSLLQVSGKMGQKTIQRVFLILSTITKAVHSYLHIILHALQLKYPHIFAGDFRK